MSRLFRWCARVLCIALAAGWAAGCLPSASSSDRPNLVFIMSDDQRYDTLGAAGHPIVRTPNLDALASEGVRFDNMFVSSPICHASRATILTGRYARSWATPERPEEVRPEVAAELYSDRLRAAGYRTAFFGKWHALMPPGHANEAHFDVYEDIYEGPYQALLPDGSRRHRTELIGDRAVEFIASNPVGTPFALTLWFNAPHAADRDKQPGAGHFPWPAAVDGLYDTVEIPAPRLGAAEVYEGLPGFLQGSQNRVRFFWRWDTPEKYTTNMRAYFRMISGVDHVVGRVLEQLERSGLEEDTIVVYTSDNGLYLGDRGLAGKWSHYDESTRVPLIVYDPQLPEAQRGRVEEALVSNVDLPATLLDWAGVDRPAEYQGESLRPLVEGGAPSGWRNDLFFEHGFLAPYLTWEGVRDGRYLYARYFDVEPGYEFLYDLDADPEQLENRAGDPAHAAALERLRARTDELVEAYGGPLASFEERRRARRRR